MGDDRRDAWNKAAVILQPVGGLLTAISVAIVGFFGSRLITQQQIQDADTRVYTELMSRREEADSTLRMTMFNNIIEDFLKGRPQMLDQDVLNLELLTYNFHESLDLGPLFKHVLAEVNPRSPDAAALLGRIERLAMEVTSKQVDILAEAGAAQSENLDFEDLAAHPDGIRLMDGSLVMPSESRDDTDSFTRTFLLEVLDWNKVRKEFRVRLCVGKPGRKDFAPEVDAVFWLGFFDFPMIDNTRLTHGQRCAVVLSKLQEESANITLIYFPGSRASLKEKPFYDDVLHELKRGRRLNDENGHD